MRIAFVTAVLTHYRVPFHERVRVLLAERGHRYDLVIGRPHGDQAAKNDTADLPWATVVHNRQIGIGSLSLLWQPALRNVRDADLVIVGQENKNLVNYILQLGRGRWFGKTALFGHGRNFQARDRDSAGERWKRFWARRCDWWFGYTEETRRHLMSLGFPGERITVFNNAVDTSALTDLSSQVTEERLAARRRELGLEGSNVGIFVGSLYLDKRIDFLIASARRVRAEIPDFELLIVGGGPDLDKTRALAAPHDWIHVLGPRFGADKVELMRLAKLFLLPGAVGLAVLDAAALGLPMVTTHYAHHGPEIAYLDHDHTGVIVPDWQDERAYAQSVVTLLRDPARLAAMAQRAKRVSETHTIEAMASRFVEGIVAALHT